MVGYFVRLRARLLRNRLRGDTALGLVMFIVIWLGALGVGLAVGGAVAILGRVMEAPELIPIGYSLAFVAWIFGPVILASVEETVVTEHFELLPVTPTQLATGMLAGALLGPAAVATLLGLSIGTVGGYASGIGDGIILLMVALTATLMCVVIARVVTTWLSQLLQGDTTRQITSMVVMAVIFLPGVAGTLISTTIAQRVAGGGSAVELPSWAHWGYLFPPAGLGGVVEAVQAGSTLRSLGAFAYGLGWLALMVWIWGRALRRRQLEVPKVGRRISNPHLWPRFIPLPDNPIGAVAAKELASIRRDPRVRMQLGGASIAMIVILVVNVVQPAAVGGDYLPFVAVMVGFVVGTSFDFNLFGLDGGSFWGYAVLSSRPSSLLAGKNLAWGLLAGVAALGAAIVGGLLGGSAAFVGPAALAAWALLLIFAAVGNLASIWGAFPLPENSLYANRHVSGRTAILSIVALMASGLVSLPPAVGFFFGVWKGGAAGGWLAGLGAVLYGATLYLLGLRKGSALLADRMARLVVALDRQE